MEISTLRRKGLVRGGFNVLIPRPAQLFTMLPVNPAAPQITRCRQCANRCGPRMTRLRRCPTASLHSACERKTRTQVLQFVSVRSYTGCAAAWPTIDRGLTHTQPWTHVTTHSTGRTHGEFHEHTATLRFARATAAGLMVIQSTARHLWASRAFSSTHTPRAAAAQCASIEQNMNEVRRIDCVASVHPQCRSWLQHRHFHRSLAPLGLIW